AAIDKISKLIVATLPSVASAQQNIIYLVPGGGSDASDNYDEYMLINGAFEKLGNTAIDLSDYVQDSDLIEITSAEIDALV
ncbi:MAG: hypothetical protein LBT56_02515, partial [Prevotellaceae bacterium]|nr:hypothetical protein [Prevotellaceae bacterium]